MRKHHCDPSCRNIKIPQHDNMKGAVLQFFFVRHFHTRHVKFMQKFSQNIFLDSSILNAAVHTEHEFHRKNLQNFSCENAH